MQPALRLSTIITNTIDYFKKKIQKQSGGFQITNFHFCFECLKNTVTRLIYIDKQDLMSVIRMKENYIYDWYTEKTLVIPTSLLLYYMYQTLIK